MPMHGIDMNHSHKTLRNRLIAGLLLSSALATSALEARNAKNVILLISDGCGYTAFDATSYYQYGMLGKQVYDQAGWLKYGCSNHPLNLSSSPTGGNAQDWNLVYNPMKMWDTSKDGSSFVGYKWTMATYTDSAAAATAIASGMKTYNNALNWTNDPKTAGTSMGARTLTERMKADGKAIGIVTSVQWSHATPAGMVAHNVSRNNYAAIANEMLESGVADVIMGAGNPDYDDSGVAKAMDAKYVGGSTTWAALKAGTHAKGWKLVQSKAEFEALTTGNPTGPVLGTAMVATTLQQSRAASGSGYGSGGKEAPYVVPMNPNVPSLATMTKGALNILDANQKGFFVMIEGGAVDWANHANQAGRMIEEQIDFNRSVEAVVEWVEKYSNWEETLVVVTSDHETGFILGPDAATKAYDPIRNKGVGQVPDLSYNSGNHTNQVIPLYARGPGSEVLPALVKGSDPVYGLYVDNTDIYKIVTAGANLASATGNSKLLAVSSRHKVGLDQEQGVVGFVVEGTGQQSILVTARGTSLDPYVGTGKTLANPKLMIYDLQGKVVASNMDWASNSNKNEIAAIVGMPLTTSEAALLIALKPGIYTAVIASEGTQTGIGLLEVYSQN